MREDSLPRRLVLRDLVIEPPLLNASGAFDVAAVDPDWRAEVAAATALGAYVTKTVTVKPRPGNPTPWVDQLAPDTLVNSVGLANPGIEQFASEGAELADRLGMPIIVSIGGSSDTDLRFLVLRLEREPWVAGYELNLSCPNVRGGPLAAADPARVDAAVRTVRACTERPVLAKLTAACGDLSAIAVAAETAGADAITAVNTMPVRALDDDGRPLLGSLDGGMSGAMLHPIALRAVATIAGSVSIPVVGVGGVGSAASARRMFGAGASAVAVGSAAAIAPGTFGELARLWR